MTERTGTADSPCLGGRYRMGTLLGTGGMGEVWAARDLLLDRAVAVKVLGGALAGDSRAAERLRREARAAARLDHPNIARVLDLGEHDGRPYLVMELLEGESLAARIDRAGPMPPVEAARIVAAVADALEAAHQAGIVHRDVKPGNVFLTSTGVVKVLDFGIASAAGDAALTTGDLIGTAAYLAPERALGQRATPAADIYALGVVLYELLAGNRPFEAGSEVELAMAHVNADPPSLRQAAPSTPGFLVAACHNALAKDPSARPPSAAAFAQLVRAPGPTPPTTSPLPVTADSVPAAGLLPPATHPLPVAAAAPPAAAPTTDPLPRPVPAANPFGPPVPPATPMGRPVPAAAPTGRPVPRATTEKAAGRRRAGHRRPRLRRRRGLLVALLLAGALLASLPALAGGLPLLVRDRIDGPFAILDPGPASPATEDPQAPVGTGANPDPGPAPADEGSPPSSAIPGTDGDQQFDPGDDRDRDDRDDRDRDDSGGSGRSGGGDSGGGSSGPG
jgi:eukaryotic-like serine/threonine-protein kinase